MSCRVQNKKVDHAFFGWLLQKARARGVERVTVSLSFRSTGRNEPAGQVLNEMNFEELENANSYISPTLDGLPHWDIVAVPDCARANSYEFRGRNVYYDTHLRQGKAGNCVNSPHPHRTNAQFASHRVFFIR